jgi:L-2-amino-thiazoline-4-carboxylic acid hydrolase
MWPSERVLREAKMPEPNITHLERRKIEAGVLIPVVQAFQRAIGEDRAKEIAREAILELARKDGERWAQQFSQDLAGMDEVFGVASSGGSLEIEQLKKSTEELHFNVTRCQYAEFFKELGLPKLGYLFSCNRDFAMAEGFSRGITLKRTQTIMEGAGYCDFRFDGGRTRVGEQDGGQRPGSVTVPTPPG